MRFFLTLFLLYISVCVQAQIASPNFIGVTAISASDTFTWEKVITLNPHQTADLAAVARSAYLDAKRQAIAEDPVKARITFKATSYTKCQCLITGKAIANGFTTKAFLLSPYSRIDIVALSTSTVTLKGN